MAAGKIFLCYRREDSAGHAGRIYDRLNQRFPGRVFMDVTGIGVGTREGQGANWTTTTLQTNDPTAVAGPIPSQVRFDGSTLIVESSYGQSAVWQKHLD